MKTRLPAAMDPASSSGCPIRRAMVSPDDLSNKAHPFGTAREIEIGMILARAHRVTYVGELG